MAEEKEEDLDKMIHALDVVELAIGKYSLRTVHI